MSELLTFDEVMEKAKKPHLLLGNGFSMAFDPQRFSFTSLLQVAVDKGIIQRDSEIYQVFEKLSTSDFESVMRLLDESEQVLEVYGADEALRDKLKSDVIKLKDYLVKIITNNHPEKSTDVTSTEKRSCLKFLGKFEGKIYTLNYDLLLYWATMEQDPAPYTDGFANTEESEQAPYVVYQNSSQSPFRVHYLHGGLHIFDVNGEIVKKTYTNSGITLIKQTTDSLAKNEYPIFVSEGDSRQKKAKILHNGYLNHCYRSLKSVKGDLVTFGTSLKKNDDHILDAIIQSDVKSIYMGVSALDSVPHVEAAIEQFNQSEESKKRKKKKTLHLYDYRTVDVWGKRGL